MNKTLDTKCIICKVGIKEANKKPELKPMRIPDELIKGLCKIHYSNYRCGTGQCGGY